MSDLYAGFAVSDITPPVGVELCGFGWYLERRSTGVIEPLLARAMVWKAGGETGALISCDLIGVSITLTREVRSLVTTATGIPPENVLLCGTHTHSGPTTIDLVAWGEPDPGYLAGLPARIAAAVTDAAARLEPVGLAYGEAPVDGLGYNREYPGGPTDPSVRVLSVTGGNGLIGVVANHSCHPVVMCEATSLISGDFVGLAVNAVGAARGAVGMFLQGASGNQNSVYCHRPQDESLVHLRDLACRFGERIEAALASARPVATHPIGMVLDEVPMPLQDPGRPMLVRQLQVASELLAVEGMPAVARKRLRFEKTVAKAALAAYERPHDSRPAEVQGVRLGDVAIVSHPSELFYEFQVEFERRTAPLRTLLVGYANDMIGYVPTRDRYDVSDGSYSYPAHFVPFMLGELPFREDAGDVLTDALVDLRTRLQDLR